MKLKKVDFNENWYKRFIESTNEKDILVSVISGLINSKKDSCLEIGLGISPYFAKKLSDKFKKYTIIEKRKVDVETPAKIILINENWENAKVDEKFGVIIASHVIYYFKDKKKAIEKIIDSLKEKGKAYFVVNGKSADYGPLKFAFENMINEEYIFTYDELMNILKDEKVMEYTVPSTMKFSSYEDLFEILKLSFDSYPEDYERLKDKIIEYFKKNVRKNKFIIDQKIIEVTK